MNPTTVPKDNVAKTEKTGEKLTFADGSELELIEIKEESFKKVNFDSLRKLVNE